jgi:NAD(P)-dependent dehydrogenase (short-subunit alcohol dehydrogenase family)
MDFTYLKGRLAVITGAGSGIGAATARRLAALGAHVALVGRTREKLDQVRHEIAADGNSATSIVADLRDAGQARDAIATAAAWKGKIDLLVNNAGIYREGPFPHSSDEVVHDLIDINLKGPVFTTRAALAYMPDGGCIINIASASGVRPLHATQSLYAATKAALIHLGNSLARELAPRRIRINTISPGPIRTPIIETVVPAEQIPAVERQLAEMVPLQRLGEAEEVADTVVYLACQGYSTGTQVLIDGGTSAL